jgi:ribosome-binding ATPase YchF (GTP1/OBG family)
MISGLGGGERDAIFGIQAARSNGADNQPWNWDGNTLRIIASEIRKSMFPIAIAANKADRVEPDRLKTALDDLEKLNLRCIPTSAEAELTLSRASNAGLITYQPGDGPSGFSVNSESILSKPQEEALERIREKTSKLEGNGLIDLLSKVVFEDLSMIVAYPVADEGKWTDAEDRKLPDSIILQSGSTARDLAYAVHTDLGDGFIRATNCVTGRTVGGDTELLMSDVIRIHSRT